MYVVPEPGDEEPGSYGIWRFMIAGADQGKGYGRAALDVVLREISLHADASKVFISCKPANETAKRLYAAFGFGCSACAQPVAKSRTRRMLRAGRCQRKRQWLCSRET